VAKGAPYTIEIIIRRPGEEHPAFHGSIPCDLKLSDPKALDFLLAAQRCLLTIDRHQQLIRDRLNGH
jgi:hypothetical protein